MYLSKQSLEAYVSQWNIFITVTVWVCVNVLQHILPSTRQTIPDYVSLEEIKDCLGGGWYVIKFMCPARRNTYWRAHVHTEAHTRTNTLIKGRIRVNPSESQTNPGIRCCGRGCRRGNKKRVDCVWGIVSKGQSWSVYVHGLATRERLSILRLKLTRDHVPGEQYSMQMKLLHMARVNGALHTRTETCLHWRAKCFPSFSC